MSNETINIVPSDDIKPVRSILFSAEYTDLASWPNNVKQYSEGITLQDNLYHFYCQPDETDDTLRIFVRCSQIVNIETILVTAQCPLGEMVIFRAINKTIDGAIGTKITARDCEWSNIKRMLSPLSNNGKLMFVIHILLR
jgi:hypothetical protein